MTKDIQEIRNSLDFVCNEWVEEEIKLFVKYDNFLKIVNRNLKLLVETDMLDFGYIDVDSIGKCLVDLILDKFKIGKLNNVINVYFIENSISDYHKKFFKFGLAYYFATPNWLLNHIDFEKIMNEKFSKELKETKMYFKKCEMENDFKK